MSGGEVSQIAEMANIASHDLLKWFKWNRFPLIDQNFECVKVDTHKVEKTPAVPKKSAKAKKAVAEEGVEEDKKHNHPVDLVFSYTDPYTGKKVMFNTDLKSYKSNSITKSSVRNALQSLGKTIDCARLSLEWKSKYNYESDVDIRGMLFVYNHDGEYDKNFYEVFKSEKVEDSKEGAGKIDLSNLPISKGQQVHIIEPKLVNYMLTIVNDTAHLHREGKFPEKEYYFYYPELTLHKAKGQRESRPATIEVLSSPYLIIEHGDIRKYDEEKSEVVVRYKGGYVIYYNEDGGTTTEFIYLLDTLSRFQILDLDCNLRIRVAHDSPSPQLRSNFEAAKQVYASDWGFDEYKLQKLQRIELAVAEITQKRLSATETGWKELV